MKCLVKSSVGYYAKVEGKPSWVESRAAAKVLRTVKLAKGVIRLLRDNGITAVIERDNER